MRESLFRRNSKEFGSFIELGQFDVVVNATNTAPIAADVWWIQGPPLLTTLRGMAADNALARLACKIGKQTIRAMDYRLIAESAAKSRKIVANSKYSYEVYLALGLRINDVIFNVKSLHDFGPTTALPSRSFVLTYIGKETEIETLVELASSGIRVVGFGSKLPLGVRTDLLKKSIDFRGRVTKAELMELYSNALFTVFPFTDEPFGYVPLESMACGTPVLTYGKQGPAETVVDGLTGWLASTRNELVQKAKTLWSERKTGISNRDCISRASMFGPEETTAKLMRLLDS